MKNTNYIHKVSYTQPIFVGSGNTKVLVLSQILPHWDESEEFFRSCFSNLMDYCNIEIIDSLSNISFIDALPEYVNSFKELISNSNAEIVIGFSFGGVLLQYLLKENILSNKKIILISTPLVISVGLKKKLQKLINLLEENKISEALNLLELYVNGDGQYSDTTIKDNSFPQIKLRLLKGFRLLLSHSVKDLGLVPYNNILSIYGKNSALVSAQDVITIPNITNYFVENAGMRAMTDQKALVSKIILDFINSENG